MVRLADAMRRARYAVAAAWLIAAALSLAAVSGAFGTNLDDLLSNRFDLPGTESDHARTLLADHFGQRDDSGFTIVFSGGVAPAAQQAALTRAASALPDARVGPLQPAGPGVSFAQIDTRLEPQPAALRVEPMRRAIGTVAGGRVYVSGQVGDQPRPPAGLRRRSAARRGDRDPDRRARAADRVRHRHGDARAAADGRRHGAGHARRCCGSSRTR